MLLCLFSKSCSNSVHTGSHRPRVRTQGRPVSHEASHDVSHQVLRGDSPDVQALQDRDHTLQK